MSVSKRSLAFGSTCVLISTGRGGGAVPPLWFKWQMAKQPRFDSEDIERLFRALIPAGGPDPFGKIEALLLDLGEEISKNDLLTDKHRKELMDELADIKTRTFGILFLQIFKTLKFFLGLLPQGRVILIVLAGIGLLTALLQDGTVSVGNIREAVAKTGLAKFIDKLLEDLTAFVEGIADHVEELANQSGEISIFISGRIDTTLLTLESLANDLLPDPEEGIIELDQRLARGRESIRVAAAQLAPAGNAASNAADLLTPALRGLDDRIRVIPTMALKLVRL